MAPGRGLGLQGSCPYEVYIKIYVGEEELRVLETEWSGILRVVGERVIR